MLVFQSSLPKAIPKQKVKMQKKYDQTKDLINNLVYIYNLDKNEIDCFKILINYFNDINSLKHKIYEKFSFEDIIKYMYSKCSTRIDYLEKKKILDYLNYEDYGLENDLTNSSSYKREEQLDRLFYNLNRIDNNIDFNLLGTNTNYNHKSKITTNNIKYDIITKKNNTILTNNNTSNPNNLNNLDEMNLELEEIEEEFENIDL